MLEEFTRFQSDEEAGLAGAWLQHDTFVHDLLQNDPKFVTGVLWLRIIACGSLGPSFEG